MIRGLFEVIAFLLGYLFLKYVSQAPEFGAVIGGWVLAMWVSLGMKRGA